jgi:Tol biopolymer transport system component
MTGRTVRLAFASVTENSDIWSLPLDPNRGRVTGEVKRLTQDTTADFQPALSPDGNRMAWVSARSGSQEIWIRDLRTGEESALTASRTDKWEPRFSPDGSRLSFSSYQDKKWTVYISPATGGTPEKVCEDCGGATGCWSSDGKRIIGNRLEGQTWMVDLTARRKSDLLSTRQWAAPGGVSPDNRWFAFYISDRLNVAPFSGQFPIEQSAWIPVMDDPREDFIWSPDGNLLYTVSGRDRFTCIWAQRVDAATKRPVGEPFAIFHSHNARTSLSDEVGRIKLVIGRDKILFNMAERTGNIWMAEWEER